MAQQSVNSIDRNLPDVTAEQEAWRSTVARGLVSVQAVLGFFLMLYVEVGQQRMAGFMIPFVLLFAAAAIPKNLPFRVRAWVFVGGNVLMGSYAQTIVGFDSGPSLAFALALMVATGLLGTRAAIFVLAFTFATFVLSGLAMTSGLIPIPERDSAASLDHWISTGFVYAFIGTIFVVTVRYVIQRIETTLADRTAAMIELEHERTERDRAELARDRAEASLEQTRKLEAVGQLAGGVAHDFNNALLVILAWTDMLKSSNLSEETRREALDDIERAGNAAAQLTRKLLSFGRKEVRAPRTLDVRSTVESTAQTIKRLLPDDIVVESVFAADLPSIYMDESQLDQVLLNLAINARDAMPQGGTLTFRAEAVTRDRELAPKGLCVALSVADTGAGMDRETIDRAFEPFYSTKGEAGTGLGLASVYGTLQQSGGDTSIASRLGAGTTVTLYLPISEAAVDQPPDVSPTGSGAGTVLVVEDEEPVRRVIRKSLEEGGFTPLEAADGSEALELARRHSGPIDLLCTDGVMPGIPTHQLIEGFHALYPDAPVLICSGFIDDALTRSLLGEGQYATLHKPFTAQIFREKVIDLLGDPTASEDFSTQTDA